LVSTLISVDAVSSACGAVLTYLWCFGLLNRMTLDRILPNYFKNKEEALTTALLSVF
jgi:hypothetical protein